MSDEKQFRVYLCGGSSCAAAGRDALARQLDEELWDAELDGQVEARVSGCQDHCDHSPNLKIWPGPYQYCNVTAETLRRIVQEHLRTGQPVTALLASPAMRRGAK